MHRTFIGNLERAQRGVNVDRLPDLEPRDLIPQGSVNLEEREEVSS
jgi:hypothetical protein